MAVDTPAYTEIADCPVHSDQEDRGQGDLGAVPADFSAGGRTRGEGQITGTRGQHTRIDTAVRTGTLRQR